MFSHYITPRRAAENRERTARDARAWGVSAEALAAFLATSPLVCGHTPSEPYDRIDYKWYALPTEHTLTRAQGRTQRATHLLVMRRDNVVVSARVVDTGSRQLPVPDTVLATHPHSWQAVDAGSRYAIIDPADTAK